MTRSGWAATAATLPQAARLERERPFWRTLAGYWEWRWVADAGCGAGFHAALLRELGVSVAGFDLELAALAGGERGRVAVGDITLPPLRTGRFDAVLCLGNTMSLLPDRAAQRRALAGMAALVRPGGVVLLQGETASDVSRDGPVVRARALEDGALHVRVFETRGRRVRMLAGAARPGGESPLHEVWLLPTSAASLRLLGKARGLRSASLPARPPGAAATWWLALVAPSD
ncbi:MAG: class I SAM-dependent methyltransferase [Acidobacteriota bacterium]